MPVFQERLGHALNDRTQYLVSPQTLVRNRLCSRVDRQGKLGEKMGKNVAKGRLEP